MSKVKLRIGFFTGGLAFTGAPIETQSLGGSETALWYAAREFKRLGHDVRVFCKCIEPGVYDGIPYHDVAAEWQKYAQIYEFDVLISSRVPEVLASQHRAKMNILWCHDMPGDSNQFMNFVWQTDAIFMLSDFQRKEYLKSLPMLDEIMYTTKNGVDLDLIRAATEHQPRDTNALIYSSRPERGLYVLLKDIWPLVHKENPKLKLYVCSYNLGDYPVPDFMRQMYADINVMLTKMKGMNVIKLGDLNKAEYYKALANCTALVYPTGFPEISCINAMEAMACGTVPISTDAFALKETINDKGILVAGSSESREYHIRFVQQLLDLLRNDVRRRGLQQAGRKWIADNYQWKNIIADWERFIIDHLQARVDAAPLKVAKELLRHDDYTAARYFVEKHKITDAEILEDVNSGFVNHEQAGPRSEEYHLADPILEGKKLLGVPPRAELCADFYKFHGVGDRFIDLGSHWGEIAAMFSRLFPGTEFTCLDQNGKNLEIAEKYLAYAGHKDSKFKFVDGTIDVLVQKIEAGELEPYDSVFAGELVEHIVDTPAFMAKLMKIVKEKGNVVITVPSGCWRPKVGFQSYERGGHVHHFEMADCDAIWGDQLDYSLLYVHAGFNYAGEPIGNWVITMRKDSTKPAFGDCDWERKCLVTRPWQKLSLGMIVKNEEDNITRCLKAVKHIVDEIIICDTGSTDKTKDLVQSCLSDFTNYKIIDIPWLEEDGLGNFGVARNKSLEAASGDWFLWQDADEILTNADNIRKYLNSRVYNGYVIKQNHLMLDMQAPPDTPIRLLKMNKGYRFYGVIHEHCQVDLDTPIEPALILSDTDLAHTGYLVESVRRWRCKERNLPLLLKDRRINPTRKLGFILVQRDYLNMMEWEFEMARGKPTEKAVKFLQTACEIYWKEIKDETHMFWKLGWPLYQRALERLGQCGIPAHPNLKTPPFQVAATLAGGVGGLTEEAKAGVRPNLVWFATPEEAEEWLTKKRKELFKLMGFVAEEVAA